ncbi:MAG: hypothetical protein FJ295_21025 [Planctomycetes bacterium]|nr:hypothetical protein [Planctomycetota bacterium]
MGSMTNAIVEYARPLLETTDGDERKMNRAMGLAVACWNLALIPSSERDNQLAKTFTPLAEQGIDVEEFTKDVLQPMIERHKGMFPDLHEQGSTGKPGRLGIMSEMRETVGPTPVMRAPDDNFLEGDLERSTDSRPVRRIGRNERCYCGSGLKFKNCCARKA